VIILWSSTEIYNLSIGDVTDTVFKKCGWLLEGGIIERLYPEISRHFPFFVEELHPCVDSYVSN